jgi:preprotein translocase subunit SecD
MRQPSILAIACLVAIVGPAPLRAADVRFSLVHGNERIDVTADDIEEIRVDPTIGFRSIETGEVRTYRDPHVVICLAGSVEKRLCELSRRLLNKPMAVVVDCQTLSEPVIREPLCSEQCFWLSIYDLIDAKAIAQRLKTGSSKLCAPLSSIDRALGQTVR